MVSRVYKKKHVIGRGVAKMLGWLPPSRIKKMIIV